MWEHKRPSSMGIDDARIYHIFDVLSLRKTESSTIQGVGLGLTIVSKLVEIMRGEGVVRDRSRKGTTFFVEIPFCSAAIR